MHAVMVAGGTPTPDDPLYAYTGGRPKALLEVAGKPMAQWVMDALDAAESVDAIVVVGMETSSGLRARKPVRFVADRHGLLPNSQAGLAEVRTMDRSEAQAMILSGDIPTLTPAIVEARIRSADPAADLDYIAIERRVMEARFPNARRTYIKLRGLEVCGGDMNIVRVDLATDDLLWERLLGARKNVWRQASLVGWDTLGLLLLRRLKLEAAVQRVSQRLHIRGRAHLFPHAEAGMD
ncbi:MAG: NTP transferase domain-containing protein, partial [Anaerolineales bacterium]